MGSRKQGWRRDCERGLEQNLVYGLEWAIRSDSVHIFLPTGEPVGRVRLRRSRRVIKNPSGPVRPPDSTWVRRLSFGERNLRPGKRRNVLESETFRLRLNHTERNLDE